MPLADNIALAVGRQLAHPHGAFGTLVGAVMHRANRRPTEALIEALDVQPGHRVLDIGCGDGALLARLDDAGWRTGLEPSDLMRRRAARRLAGAIHKGRAEVCGGDMLALPFGPARFDRIAASNILYFCANVPAFIRECRRAARPGALLGIYVTAKGSMAGWRFAGPATHRLFDAADLEAEFDRGGVACEDRRIDRIALRGGVEGLIATVRL